MDSGLRRDDGVIGALLKGVSFSPDKAGRRVALRAVFAADPAAIAELADAAEQVVPADFAGAGLVTLGNIADLDVVDDRHQLRETRRHIALRDLAVIGVELQA